ILAFTPKKAAFLINKTLKSAIANAENNANLKADGLVVKEAVVGEGPTFKRMTPRARGSGSRILKRTSHIRIVLTDDVAIETRETKKAKRDQEKKGGGGRHHPVSPWGQLAKGFKTRSKRKPSDRFILERKRANKKG
ncbi:MAG: 50S ribosomal protein L22, partial [Verrucomicrobia bacterium]